MRNQASDVKDGINDDVVRESRGQSTRIWTGTKAAATTGWMSARVRPPVILLRVKQRMSDVDVR